MTLGSLIAEVEKLALEHPELDRSLRIVVRVDDKLYEITVRQLPEH